MLRDMVKIRMDAGFPLEKLVMHNTSKFDEEDAQMLREYVGHLEWYLHGIPDKMIMVSKLRCILISYKHRSYWYTCGCSI